MTCRYAVPSEEQYVVDFQGGPLRKVENPPISLCSWAIDAAPTQLVNVPRWLSRNALAGHLLRYPDDCMGCPCFEESRENCR